MPSEFEISREVTQYDNCAIEYSMSLSDKTVLYYMHQSNNLTQRPVHNSNVALDVVPVNWPEVRSLRASCVVCVPVRHDVTFNFVMKNDIVARNTTRSCNFLSGNWKGGTLEFDRNPQILVAELVRPGIHVYFLTRICSQKDTYH